MPLVSNVYVVGRGDMKKEIVFSDFSAIPFRLYEVQRRLVQTAIKMKYNSRQMGVSEHLYVGGPKAILGISRRHAMSLLEVSV